MFSEIFIVFSLLLMNFTVQAEEAHMETSLPSIIDLNVEQFQQQPLDPSWLVPEPFLGGVAQGRVFQYLRDTYNIDTVIETGTYIGHTSRFFGHLFSNVYTVEITPHDYKTAKVLLQDMPHVHCYLDNSAVFLQKLLPSLQDQRVICFLDAHWGNYWPLLDELTAISQTHKDNCIIVIDDVQVPNHPEIDYDSYNGNPCSYAYAQPILDKIFTDYTIHYVIPASKPWRAQLVIIPGSWQS